jgi:hypothetical protein
MGLNQERDWLVYFVELEENLEERIERNKNPHRLNSIDGEINKENYIKINNTDMSPEEVAEIIKEKFQL